MFVANTLSVLLFLQEGPGGPGSMSQGEQGGRDTFDLPIPRMSMEGEGMSRELAGNMGGMPPTSWACGLRPRLSHTSGLEATASWSGMQVGRGEWHL